MNLKDGRIRVSRKSGSKISLPHLPIKSFLTLLSWLRSEDLTFCILFQNRRANAQVDADHPVIKQVEELQKDAPKWFVLLPIPSSDQDEGEEDENPQSDPDGRYAGARRAVDQLEASLNPRGIREAHLRKSISQLRPILISTVAKCPIDILAVSEEEKKMAKPRIVGLLIHVQIHS